MQQGGPNYGPAQGSSVGRDPEYSDLPSTSRRHVPRPRDNLGVGLLVADDAPSTEKLHHAIPRPRVMHDGAELQEYDSFASTTMRPQDDAWRTTYQADLMDREAPAKRRGGKKIVRPAYEGNRVIGSGGPLGGSARFKVEDEVVLMDGTTKAVGHVPGYTGHVSAANPSSVAEKPSHDKALLTANFRTQMTGYTGRLPGK